MSIPPRHDISVGARPRISLPSVPRERNVVGPKGAGAPAWSVLSPHPAQRVSPTPEERNGVSRWPGSLARHCAAPPRSCRCGVACGMGRRACLARGERDPARRSTGCVLCWSLRAVSASSAVRLRGAVCLLCSHFFFNNFWNHLQL
jgi:hypothetical protein